MVNIVFLHLPSMWYKPVVSKEIKPIIKKLSKLGKVHNYFFKFSYYGNRFSLDDLLFENVAKDIHNAFIHLKKYIIVAYNHACPMALYYADKHPNKVLTTICYPFRYYSLESYKRRKWKFKTNKGFANSIKNNKKYNVDKHLFNITNNRLQEIFDNKIGDDEKMILYWIMDIHFQKQYHKIPKKFKTKTVLFTRLDLEEKSIINQNYNRRSIAKMKNIITKNDALYNSMIWNFERIKYDSQLRKANKDNKYLQIKYLISGWENLDDIVDEVILFIKKK